MKLVQFVLENIILIYEIILKNNAWYSVDNQSIIPRSFQKLERVVAHQWRQHGLLRLFTDDVYSP